MNSKASSEVRSNMYTDVYIKKPSNTRVRSSQIRALVDDDDGRGGGVMVEGGQ